jgi:hypothetical protein
MSDPVAPAPGQPYGQTPYGVPPAPPYGQPAVPPKKKSKAGKIILIIAIVLFVLCGGVVGLFFAFRGKIVDVAYAEGNCVDSMPTSTTVQAVACTSPKAVGKILKVADGKTLADTDSICGAVSGATSSVQITISGSTKLLCLGPK